MDTCKKTSISHHTLPSVIWREVGIQIFLASVFSVSLFEMLEVDAYVAMYTILQIIFCNVSESSYYGLRVYDTV